MKYTVVIVLLLCIAKSIHALDAVDSKNTHFRQLIAHKERQLLQLEAKIERMKQEKAHRNAIVAQKRYRRKKLYSLEYFRTALRNKEALDARRGRTTQYNSTSRQQQSKRCTAITAGVWYLCKRVQHFLQ